MNLLFAVTWKREHKCPEPQSFAKVGLKMVVIQYDLCNSYSSILQKQRLYMYICVHIDPLNVRPIVGSKNTIIPKIFCIRIQLYLLHNISYLITFVYILNSYIILSFIIPSFIYLIICLFASLLIDLYIFYSLNIHSVN